MFIKRKTKLIRSQWRNGIAGVEDANEVVQASTANKLESAEDIVISESPRLVKGTDQG